ncbi:MAG: PKD domain-containing protein [Bacteroidales bacterium]|nr:PKD domain-containing protein [Bacteroidales bacterium]
MKNTFTGLVLTGLLIISGFRISAQPWEKINTGYNYILMGIEFPGNQSMIGYAGGESLTYMGDGTVIKTTDGGTTWTQLWMGVDQGIEGISFPDLNTGYVGGWSGYFAKTTNGGVTWTPQNPGTDIYYYTDVVFKDAQNGVVFAQTNSGAGVYITSNGGTTWNTSTGVSGIPYGACYVSGSTYYLVTNGGDIQRSVNDGQTWSTVYSGGGLLLGIDFYNESIGIAAGEDGRILKTYDGGATWQQQITAFGQPLWHDFAWKTQNEVYSVGTPEFIYKSTDGGASWTDDFPASTYDPALYEVLFTSDGIGYICGSQGWFYRKAPGVTAAFSASNTLICQNSTVQFTDLTTGSPTSWSWTFEGGTPSTSTLQNPVVTYSTPGVYDVTLVATLGPSSSTSTQTDLIHVDAPVTVAPALPTGATELCGLLQYPYSTTAVANASTYLWTISPANAGAFSGNGTTVTLNTANVYAGAITISVAGNSACGTGPVSPALSGNLNFQPNPYYLFSGGGYCEGEPGYNIVLADSDAGVSYELFKDGVPTGIIIIGTGNSLDFGPQPTGTYTVVGTSGSCTATMPGSASNLELALPSQANAPTGPATACNNETSVYTASLPLNAYTLSWTLNPTTAGTITASGLTASIHWASDFSGTAAITVSGSNECGNGPASNALSVEVGQSYMPAIEGQLIVCQYDISNYLTEEHAGSTYDWTVTGCLNFSGQGTYIINVDWGTVGTGTISVTETSGDGCVQTSETVNVAIEICPGFEERNQAIYRIFPNPANSSVSIELTRAIESDPTVKLLNSMGIEFCPEFRMEGSKSILLDVSNIPAGIYHLIINSGNQQISRQSIVIQ